MDTFSCSDITFGNYAVEAASVADDVISFVVKVDAESLDGAIEKVNGSIVTINGAALGAEEDVCITASFVPASFYYSSMSKEI